MTAPLQGIKVVDWTQVQSGPACTQLLAWLGADVIKIERPGTGDPTRNELLDLPNLDGLYFLQLNSNKRSIELDVKTPEIVAAILNGDKITPNMLVAPQPVEQLPESSTTKSEDNV